ncbi:MAG: hypothetical protein FWH01_03330 [Oscillospiraceae bacterium]|nr:hypothetical protein [Oscillospiraceae bacterium]
MEVLKTQRPMQDRGVDSILEIIDVGSGERKTLKEFPTLIEAPNWTVDGKFLVYNSGGRIYTYELASGAVERVDTGFADRCNNDHVLSADGQMLAISHGTREDGRSRVYTLPLAGGTPALITPIAPSYLHGISPDGGTLAYCGERNGQYDIYTIPSVGGVETQLTDLPGLDDGPEYSPCGRYIWFCSTRSGLMQVWRMDSDGGNQVQFTFDEDWNNWFPHISPDGTRIAYIAYRKGDVEPAAHPPNKHVELRLMSVGGGSGSGGGGSGGSSGSGGGSSGNGGSGYTKLAELFGGQGTINVNSWSPDSRKIAFVSYRLKNQ